MIEAKLVQHRGQPVVVMDDSFHSVVGKIICCAMDMANTTCQLRPGESSPTAHLANDRLTHFRQLTRGTYQPPPPPPPPPPPEDPPPPLELPGAVLEEEIATPIELASPPANAADAVTSQASP